MWLLLFLDIQMIYMSTIVGEYYFNSSSYSSGFVNLANNSIPVINQASTSGYTSSNDANLTDKGAYITQNKFLTLNANFTRINHQFGSFGVWVYYIQGEMMELMKVNVDYTYNGHNIFSDFAIYHLQPNNNFQVNVNSNTNNFDTNQQIKAGWNWFGVIVYYNRIYWTVWNQFTWNTIESQNWSYTNYSNYNYQQHLGCFAGCSSDAEYIIHSFKIMENYTLGYHIYAISTSPHNPYFYCGNSMLNSTDEQCDDGNFANSDGCSEFWEIEIGSTWNNAESALSNCTPSRCGDGVGTGQTGTCDDGNLSRKWWLWLFMYYRKGMELNWWSLNLKLMCCCMRWWNTYKFSWTMWRWQPGLWWWLKRYLTKWNWFYMHQRFEQRSCNSL